MESINWLAMHTSERLILSQIAMILLQPCNLIKDDRPEDADKMYRLSLHNPSSDSTWHNLGSNLNSLNRYLDAIAPLKKSLKINPLNPEVWCNLGLAFYGAEDFVRAERSFRHTIALDSSHSPGHQIQVTP